MLSFFVKRKNKSLQVGMLWQCLAVYTKSINYKKVRLGGYICKK